MGDDDDVIPIRKPKIIDEGGTVDEASATLALYGEDLDPDAVSRRLGCAPTDAHRKGDRRRPESRPFDRGAWLLSVDGKAPVGPDELIVRLLRPFGSDAEFWRALRDDFELQVRVAIHTDSWNHDFMLAPTTVAAIALTGAKLVFDLFLYGDDINERS